MKNSWYKKLWLWVIVGMVMGVSFGLIDPLLAKQTKPLVDNFIHVIKLMVCPIIFFTVVSGIMGMGSLKQLGSIGIKAFIYFELVSSFALVIGLGSGVILHPGGGMNLSVSSMDPNLISKYTTSAQQESPSFLHILRSAIPSNPVAPFIDGNTLQVLFLAIVIGFLLFYSLPNKRELLLDRLHIIQNYLFKILSYVMWFSPVAAFAAMAFMIGEFGVGIILNMLGLVMTMLVTCLFFIIVVLGIIAKFNKINIFKFLRFIKDEIILVFATSSSESALGPLMNKLRKNGVHESVVGVVVPAGYSFNLDGTNIYLALVIAFLCQAFNIQLSFEEHIMIIAILMLTSKGAAGVTGSGFIVLAGTLDAMHGKIPVVTIAILLGIDKIMSELRSSTNLIGNSLATVIIANLDNKLDKVKFNQALDQKGS